MRTSLPEIRRTAHRRARSNEISGQKPVSRLPSRSGRHRGAAERVDQTFPKTVARHLCGDDGTTTTDGEKLKFHTLNRQTEHRVVSCYADAVPGKVAKGGYKQNPASLAGSIAVGGDAD